MIPKDQTQGKFSTEARYNDVWATVLFLFNIGGFTALNVYSFKSYADNLANPYTVLDDGTRVATNAFAVDHALSILVLSSIAFTFALSFGYFILIQRKTAFLVKFSFFFNIFLTVGMGILQIMSGNIFWGGLFLVSGILVLFFYKIWAKRMPFSILLLQTVTSVTRKYPGTLAVSDLLNRLILNGCMILTSKKGIVQTQN